MPEFSVTTFRDLCNHRDCMAYHATACAQEALAKLNLGEVEAAQRILLSALALFQDAEMAINRFRKEHVNGNAAA